MDTFDYEAIFSSLSIEQKEVLDQHVKRGIKTKWLNILAKKKGIVLSEADLDSNSPVDLEWYLIEREDAGKISKDLRCICGKALRYRYTVLNIKTGIQYKLGSEHLEQYTNLDAATVKEVVRGIKTIDLEREEILEKVFQNWEMPTGIIDGIEIPNDMVEQIRVGLPLLKRQIRRLNSINKNLKKNSEVETVLSIQPFEVSEFKQLLKDYEIANLDVSEAKRFYEILSNYKAEIEDSGYSIGNIKEKSIRIMGKYGNNRLGARRWIFEITKM